MTVVESPAARGQEAPPPTAGQQAAQPEALTRDPEARLDALFDPGTMAVLTPHDDSGAMAATGKIDGVLAVAFASDPQVQGGAMGSAGCAAIVAAYDEALAQGAPVIGLWHSGGARLREGVESLHAVGTVFAAMTRASGKVPQISVVLGAAAGGAAYGPALTDVVILSNQGRIFVTGPDVVRSVTGEDVDMARLGGPEPHSRRSGVVHVVTASDAEALARAREIAVLLGDQGCVELGKVQLDTVQDETLRLESGGRDGDGSLASFLPESPRRAYD
ncbi:MAG TPA: carboxyl transferase domain-containing protein, partial [Streptosporangiaceae bacterium]|nr:carboxyl transferase domain-containing protein [Streptosporangiaceae bacterium]